MYIDLTFDDGYEEQLSIAKFLPNKGIKATFFVITGLREYMSKPLLTRDEVREISRLDHEVSSRTMTHIDMVKTPKDVIYRELIKSKQALEELLHEQVNSFAYPFGPHTAETAAIARSIYRVVRGTYVGPADGYEIIDEHCCVMALNLRLSNIYEILKLRSLETLVLYFTHQTLQN